MSIVAQSLIFGYFCCKFCVTDTFTAPSQVHKQRDRSSLRSEEQAGLACAAHSLHIVCRYVASPVSVITILRVFFIVKCGIAMHVLKVPASSLPPRLRLHQISFLS